MDCVWILSVLHILNRENTKLFNICKIHANTCTIHAQYTRIQNTMGAKPDTRLRGVIHTNKYPIHTNTCKILAKYMLIQSGVEYRFWPPFVFWICVYLHVLSMYFHVLAMYLAIQYWSILISPRFWVWMDSLVSVCIVLYWCVWSCIYLYSTSNIHFWMIRLQDHRPWVDVETSTSRTWLVERVTDPLWKRSLLSRGHGARNGSSITQRHERQAAEDAGDRHNPYARLWLGHVQHLCPELCLLLSGQ